MKQTADVFLLLHYLVHCDAVYTDVILPTQVYVTKMGKKLHRDVLKAYEEDPALFKSSLTQLLQKLLVVLFVFVHYKRVDAHRFPELSIFDIDKNFGNLVGFIIYQQVV